MKLFDPPGFVYSCLDWVANRRCKAIEAAWLEKEEARRAANPEAYYAEAWRSTSECLWEATEKAASSSSLALYEIATAAERAAILARLLVPEKPRANTREEWNAAIAAYFEEDPK